MQADVIIKKSGIEGLGVFAGRGFRKGEIVLKWKLSKELTEEEAGLLPADYPERCIELKTKGFRRIKLKALNPIDIIATKIGRLNERDIEDIRDCIKKFALKKQELKKLALKIAYVEHEESYLSNLKYVLRNLF